jgi:hypothetical protein
MQQGTTSTDRTSGLIDCIASHLDYGNYISTPAEIFKINYESLLSPEIGRNPNQPDQLKRVSVALDKILGMA